MGNGGSGSSDSARGPGKRRRPQAPILDLKATEVPSGTTPPTSAPAETPAPQSADVAPEQTAAAPAATDPAAGSTEPAREPAPPPAAEPTSTTAEPQQASDTTSGRMPDTSPSDAPDAPPVTGVRGRPEPEEPIASASVTDQPADDPSGRAQAWRIGGLALGAGVGAAAGALALLAIAWTLDLPLGRDDRVSHAATRIGALEARVTELAARPVPAPDPRIGDIATRLAAAEQAFVQVKALETRIAQAEAAAGRAQGGPDPQLATRLAALDESAKSLTATLADLRRRVDETASVAQAAWDAAAGSTANAASERDALAKRLAALEATARTLQTAVTNANTPDRDRPARFAAAATALQRAVESGAPFAEELAVAKTLAPDPSRLAPLDAFAAAGLPGAPTLTRELTTLLAEIRRSTDAGSENAGFFERLQAGAARLVRIRPVDAPPAPADASDTLARVQATAARGDLAQTLAEAGKLPDEYKTRLEPWMGKAQARVAALALSRELARESLAQLAAPGGAPAGR